MTYRDYMIDSSENLNRENNYGIIIYKNGEPQKKLYFTDDQHWDIGDADTFSVIAKDAGGKKYCITYQPPILDRYDDEDDADYGDRRIEYIDWDSPVYVEDMGIGGDYDFDTDPSLSAEYFY